MYLFLHTYILPWNEQGNILKERSGRGADMGQTAFEHMEPKKSREERLREAKLLFRGSSSGLFHFDDGYSQDGFSRDKYLQEEIGETSEVLKEEKKNIFYRPLLSIILFLLLITACQFHFSFHGIDRKRVEQVLSDDSHYQMLIKQAEMVIKDLSQKK